MACGCESEIHTLHAELIHPARDIQFQIAYTNGVLPATITDIDQKNVQSALESYFSQLGIPIKSEVPVGTKNNVNLEYETEFEFIPDSLEVFLSGMKLIPAVDYIEHLDFQGFTVLVDPQDRYRLNRAPQQGEGLEVNYNKRITFNTKGGS